jgi:hypothetical protein
MTVGAWGALGCAIIASACFLVSLRYATRSGASRAEWWHFVSGFVAGYCTLIALMAIGPVR